MYFQVDLKEYGLFSYDAICVLILIHKNIGERIEFDLRLYANSHET